MICSWVDCEEVAEHDQFDKNGKVWSSLCQKHHDLLEEGLKSQNPKIILSRWVKAQGGAKAAAKRF